MNNTKQAMIYFGTIARKMGWLMGLLLIGISPAFSQTDTTNTGTKKRGGAVISKDTAALVIIPADSSGTRLVVDSISGDSIIKKKDFFVSRFIKKGYPNPRKAALLALVVPGAGQAYNRKWWKIPLVYGALGGLTLLEINNIQDYKLLKSSYVALVDDDPLTIVDPLVANQDNVTLKANRDAARKALEQSSLILGLGYLLSVSDAFVDAHLSTFDVSDDLSMKLCPKSIAVPGLGPAFGIALVFPLE
jgi:Family of unknown function (DUF5683)